MNGTLYVQKKNEAGTLTAGWIHERPDGNTWITKPNGPGKDVLTLDTACALIFDLNNHCDEITAYIDAGYIVRTGNNLAYHPDAKRKPNSITVA